jgi:hypothetical protein
MIFGIPILPMVICCDDTSFTEKTKPNPMSASAFDRHYYDSNNWKLGFIYFCRADSRMLVPKRMRGLGWTLNFARLLAVPFLGFMVALVYGLLELFLSFGGGGDARFATKLLLALGILALGYRLANRRNKNAQAKLDSNEREAS